MKNKYMEEQILHMLHELEEFRHNYKMAARADNGFIGPFERIKLWRLNRACKHFEWHLHHIMK
ncbi:MAG: hypothetical protein MJ077_04395 [Oscillospiraceae bacterium]|nr:hypothetical protein [Oscillospiraceae bacterium]